MGKKKPETLETSEVPANTPEPSESGWRNRIVGYGVKAADQFMHHPNNPKFHPKLQRDALRGAIDQVGVIAPVIENIRTGYLVDGHERVWLALETGEEVPYIQIDVDEGEESFILATLDPIGWLAEHDKAKLDAVLKQINADNEAVQQMLTQLAAQEGLIPPDNPYDEWQGVPEYEQENTSSPYSLKVHFNSEADIEAFANLIGQTVTPNTKFIYYPAQVKENLKLYQVVDES